MALFFEYPEQVIYIFGKVRPSRARRRQRNKPDITPGVLRNRKYSVTLSGIRW